MRGSSDKLPSLVFVKVATRRNLTHNNQQSQQTSRLLWRHYVYMCVCVCVCVCVVDNYTVCARGKAAESYFRKTLRWSRICENDWCVVRRSDKTCVASLLDEQRDAVQTLNAHALGFRTCCQLRCIEAWWTMSVHCAESAEMDMVRTTLTDSTIDNWFIEHSCSPEAELLNNTIVQ